MFNNQITTVETERQAVVFMLDLTGELVNEPRTGERDASGQWLKKNVKFAKTPKAKSFDKQMLAAKYGCEAEDLFL